MHNEIYQHFNSLDITPNKVCSDPTSIWTIDNFLPQHVYDAVVNEIDDIPNAQWSTFENSTSSRSECRNPVNAPLIETLQNTFNSSKTINWLQEQVGVQNLVPDPHLRGGGLCRIHSGSKLDLHTDFNWNDQIKLNRQVNLILYLNEEWNDSWGGDLEFWDNEKTKCMHTLAPKPNRLAFWIYDTDLVHGFPNELQTPKDVSRDNLIFFYYTSNGTWEKEPRRSQFM
jgi:hypothetical protein